MSQIITYLLIYNQYLINQIYELTLFIAKHIPIKQWAFEDYNSPVYQKFKVDKLPIIKKFIKQDYSFLLVYYLWKYGKPIRPVQRRNGKTVPESTLCPYCGAPHHYIYDNTGGKGQYQCKVCGQTFVAGEQAISPLVLICPYCGHALSAVKDRKHFIVHKCINKKCSYYTANLKQLPDDLSPKDKYKYKLQIQKKQCSYYGALPNLSR